MRLESQVQAGPIDVYLQAVQEENHMISQNVLLELSELGLDSLIAGREKIINQIFLSNEKSERLCLALTIVSELIKKKEFDVIPEPTTATVGPLDKSLDDIIITYKVEHLFCLELIFSMLELADKLKLCLKRFVQEEE